MLLFAMELMTLVWDWTLGAGAVLAMPNEWNSACRLPAAGPSALARA